MYRIGLLSEPDLMSLLPPYFKAVKDLIELVKTEDIELSRLESYILQTWDNFYIQTCDEATLEYHEALLRITALSNDDIEFRRLRILNRYNNLAPITLVTLKERLNLLVGFDNYIIGLDYNNYNLSLLVKTNQYVAMTEILNMLTFMVPAHLTIDLKQYTSADSTQTKYINVAAMEEGEIRIGAASQGRAYTQTKYINVAAMEQGDMRIGG